MDKIDLNKLLKLKKFERPDEAFWDSFDTKLRQRTLKTLIERTSVRSTELSELADRDLVIEAIVEDTGAKNELFSALDGLCGPDTIFASNTSSLTITDMAAATGRPDRVVGLHFFNPVPVMELVEVVRTIVTSDEAFSAAYSFAEALGKKPIVAKGGRPACPSDRAAQRRSGP